MDELFFYVNGIEVRERFESCEPDEAGAYTWDKIRSIWLKKSKKPYEKTLLEYLRRQMHLCGTKLACGEGGCGACTVMISELRNEKVIHSSVNACLTPIGAVRNCLVTTIEAKGSATVSFSFLG